MPEELASELKGAENGNGWDGINIGVNDDGELYINDDHLPTEKTRYRQYYLESKAKTLVESVVDKKDKETVNRLEEALKAVIKKAFSTRGGVQYEGVPTNTNDLFAWAQNT